MEIPSKPRVNVYSPNLQRNLNNAFAYDLVPSPSVITAALKAARRVNDYPTAVRIFEGTLKPFPHFPPIEIQIFSSLGLHETLFV